jgi:hypothetical protein
MEIVLAVGHYVYQEVAIYVPHTQYDGTVLLLESNMSQVNCSAELISPRSPKVTDVVTPRGRILAVCNYCFGGLP